jgi:hypothetical protein
MAYRKLSLVGTVLLLALSGGCGSGAASTGAPSQTIVWAGRGGGFRNWGCGGDLVYAQSVQPSTLEVMKWREGTLEKCSELPFERRLAPVCTSDRRAVCCKLGKTAYDRAGLEIRDLYTGVLRDERLPPDGWSCDTIGSSRNGQYVVIAGQEDLTQPPPDYRTDRERLNVGLISPGSDDVVWKAIVSGTGAATDIRSAVASDDGTLVAVAAWEGGVALIDVNAGRELWTKMPGSNAVQYVAFSPDSKIVYAGGTEGAVFGLDVATGKVLSTWYATSSGREEYGERISCLAVSPDGRWVAAGTGPEGVVYVGATATNKLVRVLNHGGGTIALVHFSPDSQALASFVPGTLKIWKVSEWK